MVSAISTSYFFSSREMELKQDPQESEIPNFRIFPFNLRPSQNSSFIPKEKVQPYLSASGQFSTENFDQLLQKIQQIVKENVQIFDIDLRYESHGFVNGIPITWTSLYNHANKGKRIREIEIDEIRRLRHLEDEGEFNHQSIKQITSEKGFIESLNSNIHYIRLPILNHCRPGDLEVEDFIQLIQQNPNAWLHIHCHHGKTRTTLMTTMFAMYFYAKDLSFDELLDQQQMIGGKNLKKHLISPYKDPNKQQFAIERFEFLNKFYQFCREADLNKISWTHWSNTQKEKNEIQP